VRLFQPSGGRVIGRHSSKGSITALDSRTTVAKLLRKITADLLDHLGDPTAPRRLIVQRPITAIAKAGGAAPT
jgi:hypothetical protein